MHCATAEAPWANWLNQRQAQEFYKDMRHLKMATRCGPWTATRTGPGLGGRVMLGNVGTNLNRTHVLQGMLPMP